MQVFDAYAQFEESMIGTKMESDSVSDEGKNIFGSW